MQSQHSASGFAFPEKFRDGFQRICAKNIFGRGRRFDGLFNGNDGFDFNFRDGSFAFRLVDNENIFAVIAAVERFYRAGINRFGFDGLSGRSSACQKISERVERDFIAVFIPEPFKAEKQEVHFFELNGIENFEPGEVFLVERENNYRLQIRVGFEFVFDY